MFGCNARVDSYKVRKTAPAASSLPYGWGGTTLSVESQVQGECDGIARTLFAPTEVSISTVTAVFLVPVVIVMMLRRQEERG